ncbi:hypothetical protein UlMin_027370 [Ulmus minor]
MKKTELVFVPTPVPGHLVSTIQFAKQLLRCDNQLSVMILIIKLPKSPTLVGVSSNSLETSASHPNIRFIDVPIPQNLSPRELFQKSTDNFLDLYVESHKPNVKDVIASHVLTKPVSFGGLVVDLFCTAMVDVAKELGAPSYVFFTCGVASLGFIFYMEEKHNLSGAIEYKESDPESHVPSYVNPIPTKALPSFVFKTDGYMAFVSRARRIKKTDGIIVNSVLDLESHAMTSFSGGKTPPVYTVGPLIDHQGSKVHQQIDQNEREKIMTWIDDQPSKLVVFMCFGSYGTFSAPELREIAIALERTGHRFLWSVRLAQQETKLEECLPEGFLERTKDTGMICGWAPQEEVLAHKATGGFVSHCGWNSILESLWFGVPLVTWPLYAEQQLNAFQMAKDLGLAVELRLDSRRERGPGGDVVMADEIEKAVRCVMDGDCDVRKRVEEMSEKCRMAVADGGSSFQSLGQLIDVILTNAMMELRTETK